MLNKPFRPPLLRQPVDAPRSTSSDNESGPPLKKQRIGDDEELETRTVLNHPQPSFRANQLRKPLLTLHKPQPSGPAVNGDAVLQEAYYNVLWRRFTNKKHKTWDGDGILYVSSGYARLQDVSGRDMGKTSCSKPLEAGSQLSIGGKEIEIESAMPKEEYLAGRKFLGSVGNPTLQELEDKIRLNVKVNMRPKSSADTADDTQSKPINLAAPTNDNIKNHFKNPLLESTVIPKGNGQTPTPRHDANAPDALVMKRPSSVPRGKQLVDVVVDPLLCKRLREHQREGVKFMYECVMGMRPHSGEGAILADEMGLGKTLQVIALLWTLLKQNPINEDPPIIKKALIVCPVTLIKNWRKEFRKWLGNERIGVFVFDDKKSRLTDFTKGRSYSIMIIGYEKLRTVYEELQKDSGIDIVIADEGHRLKTEKNKSAQAIKSLKTERRIMLSGTPLQNDLSEFYYMVEFVNPGLLGKLSTFKREFETPILKSRQPGATVKEIEKGDGRSAELAQLTSQFILRRTAEILSKYLPSKSEFVLLCRPTAAQASVYRNVVDSSTFGAILRSPDATLQLITVLKKLCNSPNLLCARGDAPEEGKENMVTSILSGISPTLLSSPGSSGKLQVLDQLLHILRTTTSEKVVLVSHYTSTLDILGNLLTSLSYPFLRLDGSTPAGKRTALIDKFNRSDAYNCFAFLLSAKSGGAGINLIGASRLVLFDLDWNPSTDLQAMARIHRDGQKRPCKIYRLLTQGALDEKIYQRQLTKLSLADSVVDNKVSTSNFTIAELRDLFTLDEAERCQTHELLKCKCDGRGEAIVPTNLLPDPLSSDDVEEDLPDLPLLLKASQVDFEAQARRIEEAAQVEDAAARAEKSKMLALMQYLHLDTRRLTVGDEEMEALVDDDVLWQVLLHKENRVGFVFAKGVS